MYDNLYIIRSTTGRVSISFPTQLKPLYPYEKCQIQYISTMECTYVIRISNSVKHSVHMIKKINDLGDNIQKKTPDGWIVCKWVVKCTHSQDIGPIKVAVS